MNKDEIELATQKQIPMKPTHDATIRSKFTCPICLNVQEIRTSYCCFCGQKLDWE